MLIHELSKLEVGWDNDHLLEHTVLEHRPNTETNIGTSNDNLLEHTMLDIFFPT